MVIDDTYSDEVIQIITNGIGFILGKAIRKNYYELKDKLLKSLPYHKEFSIEDAQIAIDIIALSVYHQAVVLPFYGSSNFFERMRAFDISSVQMGTYKLSADDYRNMQLCTKAFYAILGKNGMTPATLSIPSIDDLIERIKNHPVEPEERNQ